MAHARIGYPKHRRLVAEVRLRIMDGVEALEDVNAIMMAVHPNANGNYEVSPDDWARICRNITSGALSLAKAAGGTHKLDEFASKAPKDVNA